MAPKLKSKIPMLSKFVRAKVAKLNDAKALEAKARKAVEDAANDLKKATPMTKSRLDRQHQKAVSDAKAATSAVVKYRRELRAAHSKAQKALNNILKTHLAAKKAKKGKSRKAKGKKKSAKKNAKGSKSGFSDMEVETEVDTEDGSESEINEDVQAGADVEDEAQFHADVADGEAALSEAEVALAESENNSGADEAGDE